MYRECKGCGAEVTAGSRCTFCGKFANKLAKKTASVVHEVTSTAVSGPTEVIAYTPAQWEEKQWREHGREAWEKWQEDRASRPKKRTAKKAIDNSAWDAYVKENGGVAPAIKQSKEESDALPVHKKYRPKPPEPRDPINWLGWVKGVFTIAFFAAICTFPWWLHALGH